MTQEKWTAVDDYINGLFIPRDTALEAALTASDDAGLPAISVSPAQGKMLYLLATAKNARNILEIGTLGGYSAIWLARALSGDGKLTTIEANPKHAEVARANITRAGLIDFVDIRLGAALDVLPQIATEIRPAFDMVFIDADKESYPQYLEWSLRLSHVGTMIVADNVVRRGEVINEDSESATVQGTRRFNELLAADARISSTIIQTVGSKGYDGFALAVVMSE